MNRYAKLVHYELLRLRKLYMALLLITLLSQFTGLYLYAKDYMHRAYDNLGGPPLPASEFIAQNGIASFSRFTGSGIWFTAPIALAAAALLLYMFLIWYRDWLGKNMFIYRLLMLPTSRFNVYMAKASVILLATLGMVGFQLLLLPLQNASFNALIPSEYREYLTVSDIIAGNALLKILIPPSFTQFVLYYAAGAIGVIVVFTAILLERSYRLKGAIGGIVYFALAVGFLIMPIVLTQSWFPNYFYPSEQLAMEAIAWIVIGLVSLRFSFLLINKKVTV